MKKRPVQIVPVKTVAKSPLLSRGAVLAAMIILTAAGIFLYAAPAWPFVLMRLAVDGGAALLWLIGAIGWGRFLLAICGLHDAEQPASLRWATAAAAGLGVISLATLGLGLAGGLNGIVAWGIVIAGVAIFLVEGVRRIKREGQTALAAGFAKPADWQWLWLLAVPFLALAIVCTMTPAGILWNPAEPHGYDVVEYHLQIPREWYEAHRIIPLHHNVFSFFPFNVEMHYLLAMHLRGGPWAGMYLAQLMHLCFFALTVVTVYGFAKQHGKPASAIIAALSLLTVPWITQIAGIAYDEGGFLLFGTLSIGYAAVALFCDDRRLQNSIIAGLMGGFAAGCKLTAVPEVLVAVPVVGLAVVIVSRFARKPPGDSASESARSTTRPSPLSSIFVALVLYCVAGGVVFSPWIIRNVIWARNPVFPELMPMLGQDDFTPTQVERWDKAHKPPPAQQPWSKRIAALNREVLGWIPTWKANEATSAWQFGYVLIPLGLIAIGVAYRRPQVWFFGGLLICLTLFWLGMTHLQSRFFILAAPICALAVGYINWKRFAAGGVVLIAIFAGVGFFRMHARLSERLFGIDANHSGLAPYLGMDAADFYGKILPADLPTTGVIYLIGDAAAYRYPIPMSRLRYRTVFNVRDGRDIVQAWLGDDVPQHGDCLLIDPPELRRFHATYYGLPAIPPDVERAALPYMIVK